MKEQKLLVALEGVPGGGKTTLMEGLRSLPHFEGVNQILPDNNPNDEGLTLAKILQSDQLKTLAYLRSNKKVVVLDRYYQSTLAYHWAADKAFNESRFYYVKEWSDNSIRNGSLIVPDYTFYIDVPFKLSLERKKRTIAVDDTSPWENKKFLQYMREYYLGLFRSTAENAIFIDGQRNLKKIEAEIIKTILQDKE